MAFAFVLKYVGYLRHYNYDLGHCRNYVNTKELLWQGRRLDNVIKSVILDIIECGSMKDTKRHSTLLQSQNRL